MLIHHVALVPVQLARVGFWQLVEHLFNLQLHCRPGLTLLPHLLAFVPQALAADADRLRVDSDGLGRDGLQALGFVGLGDGQVLWPETLRALARHRRAELLDDLNALLPLIEHLGGAEAVQETFLAMRDVARWWP